MTSSLSCLQWHVNTFPQRSQLVQDPSVHVSTKLNLTMSSNHIPLGFCRPFWLSLLLNPSKCITYQFCQFVFYSFLSAQHYLSVLQSINSLPWNTLWWVFPLWWQLQPFVLLPPGNGKIPVALATPYCCQPHQHTEIWHHRHRSLYNTTKAENIRFIKYTFMGETNQETKEQAGCLQVSKEGFYTQTIPSTPQNLIS